jgi:hypothetical protein
VRGEVENLQSASRSFARDEAYPQSASPSRIWITTEHLELSGKHLTKSSRSSTDLYGISILRVNSATAIFSSYEIAAANTDFLKSDVEWSCL